MIEVVCHHKVNAMKCNAPKSCFHDGVASKIKVTLTSSLLYKVLMIVSVLGIHHYLHTSLHSLLIEVLWMVLIIALLIEMFV